MIISLFAQKSNKISPVRVKPNIIYIYKPNYSSKPNSMVIVHNGIRHVVYRFDNIIQRYKYGPNYSLLLSNESILPIEEYGIEEAEKYFRAEIINYFLLLAKK